MNRRAAFTLVELAVVLLILAITAAAVVLHVRSPRRAAQMDEVVARIADYDRLTRLGARETGEPALLVVQVNHGGLRRTTADGFEDRGGQLELPEGFRINRLMFAGGEEAYGGEAAVPVGGRGYSPSYAVQVVGPDGTERWLLVAGMTGQVSEMADRAGVEEVLGALR